MFASHYVLQYHLYVTALHRFLKLRVRDYDYDRDMGGAWYAFLRGIDGTGRGWFHDCPPRALISALDALMTDTVTAAPRKIA
jgi:exodeoxyribonuclease V beta subunit